MSLANPAPTEDQTLYSVAELVQMRREILRYARSLPAGPERNQHRQVAASLRALFGNKTWLDTHTYEGSE
jgi:hypothetical protein